MARCSTLVCLWSGCRSMSVTSALFWHVAGTARCNLPRCRTVCDPCHTIRCVGVSAGGPMSRILVGLLAAVGATMSALVGLTHGDLVPVMIAVAGTASGLAAYLALPSRKEPDHTMRSVEAARRSGARRSLAAGHSKKIEVLSPFV